jgi:outer membrane receptor protein involved in Fe transport
MKKTIILSLLTVLCLYVSAQNKIGKLTGIIKDAAGNPIPSVTVSLLKGKDSSLAKTALTDKSGKYEIEFIPVGTYLVSAGYVGYKKVYSNRVEITEAQPERQVNELQFTQSTTNLEEVTVVSKKPFIETKIDRTIVNVDASPSSAGATALEMLEKSPGVIVNNDGIISLRGKPGVIVMMDGKQTFLSPTDLANLLKNMPASSIEQFEIMTNPSAKYDAAGNSGIINIKTKKGKANGFNGSVTLGATASFFNPRGTLYVMPKSQNSFNFNYRKDKFNFFGNYNPNFFKGRNLLEIDRKFISSNGTLLGYNDVVTNFKFRNTNHTLKLGFDYFADKKNTFGFTISGFTFHGYPTPVTVTDSKDENRQLLSRMISKTENDNKFQNLSTNLNFRHVYDSTGRELTADFDFVAYRNTGDMLLTTDFYNPAGNATDPTLLLKGHLPSIIDIYTFKSDYTHPFKSGLKLEAGIKTSYVTTDNEVDYRRFDGAKWDIDNRSNHFVYKENINAAYVNVNKQIKKWSLQGGLRLENTIAKGHQLTNDSTFTRNFTNLFPSAFISYAINKTNSLTVSYSRRITRPNYQDLNPFTFFLDSLSYRQGNPFLLPQFTHNMELTHAFKGKIITTLNYNTTKNVISQLLRQNDNDRIVFLTVDNVAQFRNIGVSVTVPVAVTKWWNLNFFTNVFNNHYKGIYNADPIDISYTSFMANATNSFTIKKGFTMELSGFYRAKGVDNLSVAQPVYMMNMAAQKQIMKGKGTLRLNVRDPFAWMRFRALTEYSNIYVNIFSQGDARQVTATFTYRFGKSQQGPQRRRSNASQEEQNRVGSGN